jgi:hypothetical protein
MNRSTKGVLQGEPTNEHIRLDDQGHPVRVVDVRQRFGGLDAGASIAGALAALGVTVLLGGIAGGIGTIGYQLDVERGTDQLSAGGLAAGLVVLVAAFLVGGWVAGRIARYDGGRNGLLTAVWFIVAAAVLAGLGAWLGDKYDVFANLQVPQWFSDNATTATAIVSGVIAAAVMLAAGYLGGVLGARYHARADAYLAAEERDLITGGEPLETTDATGHRHVTGAGPTLGATAVDRDELPHRSPSRREPAVGSNADEIDLREPADAPREREEREGRDQMVEPDGTRGPSRLSDPRGR